MSIAFIFARGGSKGVKDKNIQLVGERPLVGHSISCALNSRHINKVVVSTDSDKIASVSREYGAEILVRPDVLATDQASEILAWRHAIQSFEDLFLSAHPSPFISIPTTSPLRNTSDIDRAIEKFTQTDCDLVIGVSESHRNPYLNMVIEKQDGLVDLVIPGSDALRRQESPEVFDITTCVYVADPGFVMQTEKLLTGRVAAITIPAERSLDIDTAFDLHMARLLMAHPFEGENDE